MPIKVIARDSLTGAVSGSLDNIDGDLLVDGGLAIVGQAPNILHYYLDVDSGEVDNSPYIISPAVNPGTKRWKPLYPSAPYSNVVVSSNTAINIVQATSTVIPFEVINRDVYTEYNASTGLFTSKFNGFLRIMAKVRSEVCAWTAGQYFQLEIWKNNALSETGPLCYAQADGTYSLCPHVFADLGISIGGTIQIKAYSTRSFFTLEPGTMFNDLYINGHS